MSTPSTETRLEIRPTLPFLAGLFDLPGESPIASHTPHEPFKGINEHLHEHLHHMHISYGFKIPAQTSMPDFTKLEVAMAVLDELRVDCNPIFVSRRGNEGTCIKVANQDVHWVHSEEVGQKARARLEATGRKLPNGYYFAGFRTSDVDERVEYSYTREELEAAVGQGLVAEQHFQATWHDPRDEPIEPFDVTIYLGDSESSYHTFFKLPVLVPLGAG
jgi:hypothetical protein